MGKKVEFIAKCVRIGNSKGVRVPKWLLEEHGWKEGDKLQLTVVGEVKPQPLDVSDKAMVQATLIHRYLKKYSVEDILRFGISQGIEGMLGEKAKPSKKDKQMKKDIAKLFKDKLFCKKFKELK